MTTTTPEGRPKALFICSRLPYPHSYGLPLRQSTQIEALAQDYDVTVAVRSAPATLPAGIPTNVTIAQDDASAVHTQHAPTHHFDLDRLFTTLRLEDALKLYMDLPDAVFDPISPQKPRNDRRANYLTRLQSQSFDLVWVSRLENAWAIGPIGATPSVLDLDDLESSAYTSQKLLNANLSRSALIQVARRAVEIANVERQTSRTYTRVTLAASADAQKLNMPQARVLPNCIPPASMPRTEQPDQAETILSIGFIGYLPNLHGLCWFLREVWPALHAQRPAARLDVVGECFGANAHPGLLLPPNVALHGFVADSEPFWEAAKLLIVPLFAGGGTRIKVLEAWSRGVPVVTTSLGVAGLGAVDGEHALIADTPTDFASKCALLLASPELRQRLALAARELVATRYAREHALATARQIAQEATARQ